MEIFVASFVGFGLSAFGLALGLVFRGRPLRRGCGRLAEAELLPGADGACPCGRRRPCEEKTR